MSTTFDVAELNRNIFIGKTGRIARPWADDPDTVYYDEASLREQQRRWDQAKSWDDHNAKLGADRLAKLDADREADATRRQQEARADLEAAVKQRFMAQRGVDESDWERLKGELIDRELISAPNAVEAEKAKMRRSGAYNLF